MAHPRTHQIYDSEFSLEMRHSYTHTEDPPLKNSLNSDYRSNEDNAYSPSS